MTNNESRLAGVDKTAERRRKNRESSSRCYYNRKRVLQQLNAQIGEEKTRLARLYDRALQLRHDNARLKKEVVVNGYALPLTRRSARCSSAARSSLSLSYYLQMLNHSYPTSNPPPP